MTIEIDKAVEAGANTKGALQENGKASLNGIKADDKESLNAVRAMLLQEKKDFKDGFVVKVGGKDTKIDLSDGVSSIEEAKAIEKVILGITDATKIGDKTGDAILNGEIDNKEYRGKFAVPSSETPTQKAVFSNKQLDGFIADIRDKKFTLTSTGFIGTLPAGLESADAKQQLVTYMAAKASEFAKGFNIQIGDLSNATPASVVAAYDAIRAKQWFDKEGNVIAVKGDDKAVSGSVGVRTMYLIDKGLADLKAKADEAAKNGGDEKAKQDGVAAAKRISDLEGSAPDFKKLDGLPWVTLDDLKSKKINPANADTQNSTVITPTKDDKNVAQNGFDKGKVGAAIAKYLDDENGFYSINGTRKAVDTKFNKDLKIDKDGNFSVTFTCDDGRVIQGSGRYVDGKITEFTDKLVSTTAKKDADKKDDQKSGVVIPFNRTEALADLNKITNDNRFGNGWLGGLFGAGYATHLVQVNGSSYEVSRINASELMIKADDKTFRYTLKTGSPFGNTWGDEVGKNSLTNADRVVAQKALKDIVSVIDNKDW